MRVCVTTDLMTARNTTVTMVTVKPEPLGKRRTLWNKGRGWILYRGRLNINSCPTVMPGCE